MSLHVSPSDLKFPFEIKKQISASLRLENTSGSNVAFKVKTTSPKKYCVRPNTGIVPPYASTDVTVTMQAQREVPQETKDKFLVQSTIAPESIDIKNIPPELFTKSGDREVFDVKLRVIFVNPPQPPSPIVEVDEDHMSPTAAGQPQHDDFAVPEIPTNPQDLQSKYRELSTAAKNAVEERDRAKKEYQKLYQQMEKLKTDAAVATTGKAKDRSATTQLQRSGYSVITMLIIALLAFVIGYFLKGTASPVPS